MDNLWKYALVGSGGFLGPTLRYWLSGVAHALTRVTAFPVGTLAVNLAGCLVIGFLTYLIEDRGVLEEQSRLFLVVGILGGFTTFSAFGNETLSLMRDAEWQLAVLNIIGNVVLGMAAVWAGNTLAHIAWR
jgi:fluoride exporter